MPQFCIISQFKGKHHHWYIAQQFFLHFTHSPISVENKTFLWICNAYRFRELFGKHLVCLYAYQGSFATYHAIIIIKGFWMGTSSFTHLPKSDESLNPLANGLESIFNFVINWFWYAVTAVKTVEGNTNVLCFKLANSDGTVGILCPGDNCTKCIRGWYRCIEFKTTWNRE